MLLKVKNLSKSFNTRKKKIMAVDNLSFEIPEGKITAFLGFNGAGKTTSLKAILNLLVPDKGEIYFDGKLLKDDFTPLLKQTGVVLESARNIFFALTPMENFAYWGGQRGLDKQTAHRNGLELLGKFNLLSKKDTVIFKLSRGMQQIIAICCALIARPKFLILDEPTLGLDIEAVKTMEKMLQVLASENVTILLTTHELDFAQKIADQILLIKKGRLIYSGTKNECLAKFNQEKIFTVKFLHPLSEKQEIGLKAISKVVLLVDKTYEVTLFDKKSQGQLLQQLAQFELVDIKTKSKSLNDVVDFYMKEGNSYDNTQSGISA